MLYLSTRNKADSFTAYRVLHSSVAPDGGQFMPMQIPVFDATQIEAFASKSVGEAIAEIMNLFFGTGLTGWDVDFAVGRHAVNLAQMGHKVSIAETWHNPEGSHSYFVQRIYRLVCGEKQTDRSPNLWFLTALYIAVLFGLYGKFCRQQMSEFDVALPSGDLQLLLAIRYAQKMGLPIQKVILAAGEKDGLWEFISYGDYTATRRAQPTGLEALLWLEFGYKETQYYLTAVENTTVYRLKEPQLDPFRKGIFISVVGEERVDAVIRSILDTKHYRMEQATARAFGALQDYRAKTGENRNTMLFAQQATVKR